MAEPAQQFNDEAPAGNADSAPPGGSRLRLAHSGEGDSSPPQGDLHAVDQNTTPEDTKSQLQALEGGGETTDPKTDHLSDASQTENQQIAQAGGPVSSLYKKDPKQNSNKKNTLLKRALGRKRTLFGGGSMLAIIVALAIGLFSSGPFQFIHMSHLLEQFHMQAQQDQQDDRMSKLSRYIRYRGSGQMYKTNLGIFQNKVANNIEKTMNDAGVESAYNNDTFGANLDGYVMDSNKLSQSEFGDLKGKSHEEVQKYFKDNYNVDISYKDASGKPLPEGKFFVDVSKINSDFFGHSKLIALNKTILKVSGYRNITGSIAARIMGKRAGSTWHPITREKNIKGAKLSEKIKAWWKDETNYEEAGVSEPLNSQNEADPHDKQAQANASGQAAAANAALSDGQQTLNDIKSGDTTAFDKFKTTIKTNLSPTSALTATGWLCTLKGLDSASSRIKEVQVALPLIRVGNEVLALGSQEMSRQDLTLQQVGFFQNRATGKDSSGKKTTWSQAQSIQAELGNSVSGKGIGTPNETLKSLNGTSPFSSLNGTNPLAIALGPVCSEFGQAFQVVVGFLGGGDIETQLLSFGVQTIVGGPLLDEAAHWLAGAAVDPTAVGADWGNQINFGTRLSANLQAVSHGGRALSKGEESALTAFEYNQSEKDFQSHGIAYKLLNPYDYHSAISKVIDSTNPDPSQELSKMGTMFINFGHLFSSLPKIFTATAHAAPKPYDYGFPAYGFSVDEMNNSAVKNPYANADQVIKQVLPKYNYNCSGQTCSNYFVDRAKDCFGVTIDPTTFDISSFGASSIDPNTSSADPKKQNFYYDPSNKGADKDCLDSSTDWLQTRFYIFDTQTMEAAACYVGDSNDASTQQACTNMGLDDSSNVTSGNSTASAGNLPTGTSQQLAQQLLPLIAKGQIFCGASAGGLGAVNCHDIQATATGQPIGGNCQVNALTPHLLGLILGLTQDGWSLGISATCSDHHVEGDGPYGGHSYGSVADFSVQEKNGARASGAAAAVNTTFINDAANLLSSTGGSFGQVTCSPASAHAAVLNNPKFTTFSDTCNHQHIRAAP